MRKVFCAVLIIAALALCFVGQADVQKYQLQFFDVFDTFSQITIYSDNKQLAQQVTADAHDVLLECHQLFDIYNDYPGLNNLKTINDMAGKAPVQVDDKLFELIRFGKEMYYRTDGRLNIAMGGVLRIWHDHREAGMADPAKATLPDMADLRAAAATANVDNIILDEENRTVFLADPNMSLDVGAIGKGFGVEMAARTIEASGATNVLLDIGGNVRAIGVRSENTPWRVGVQNPDLSSDQPYLTVTSLRDLSLVSSGDYQRTYTVDGKAYHHIVHPETLMPAEYFHQVTVLTRDSGLADGLSTALFLMPLEEGRALVDSLDGVEVMWVLMDGTVVRSDGFAAFAGE